MTGAGAGGAAQRDDKDVAARLAAAKWLHLAAAPTFAIMALSALDSGQPNAFCSAAGSLWPGGMVRMYLLMALFHLTPWLKLMSWR